MNPRGAIKFKLSGYNPQTLRISAVIIAALLYVLIEVIPGRFTTTDEVAYKAAGLHWALSNTFSAPELSGFLKNVPPLDEIDFAHLPIYPFFYGVFTRLAGFGPRQCIVFDAIIHVALAIIVGIFANRIMSVPAAWSYGLAAAVLPLGTYGRPDELGICFGFAGLLITGSNRSCAIWKGLLSGAAFGLCLATSLGAFAFIAPLYLYQLFRQDSAPGIRRRLFLMWCTTLILVAFACILPISINHPAAYKQFEGHLGKRVGLLGLVLGERSAKEAWSEIVDAWRGAYSYVAVLAGGYVIGIAAFFADRSGRRVLLRKMVAPSVLLCVLVLVLPDKPLYTWFVAPWLISVSLAAVDRVTINAPRAAFCLFAAALYLIACVPYAKSKVTLLTLPSDQRLDVNVARVRRLIPPGARVITLEYWWALADRCKVIDPMFSEVSVDDVDFAVMTGNGSGRPGTALPFEQYETGLARDFTPIANYLNQHPLYVGPIRATNSAYGFGALVLARRR